MVQVALVCAQTYICRRKPDGPGSSSVRIDIYMYGPVGSRVCTDIYKWKETRWSRCLVCVQTYICRRKPDGPVGSRVCTDIYVEGNQMVQYRHI